MNLITWFISLLPGGRRYVSSRNSKDHLFHMSGAGCPYCGSILDENRLYFRKTNQALKGGLSLCRICNKTMSQKTLNDYT